MTSNAISEEVRRTSPASDRSGKYLVFHLGREEFAIAVLKVREITGLHAITAVPGTPVHVKGVINLRGNVIPVLDLRLKFGLPAQDYTQQTCIIVAQLRHETGAVPVGLVVDGVAEVLNLATNDIENTPNFGPQVSLNYLLGMAKIKGKVKILLDIDQALTGQELHGLDAILQQTKQPD